jgi:hypothetical protein
MPNCAVVVNNCSSFSDPVNILRDMGVTKIVGLNITMQKYEDINTTCTNAYILNTPPFSPAIQFKNAESVYESQIPNTTNFIRLHKLSSVLQG